MSRPETAGEAEYSPPQSGHHTLSSIAQQIQPTGKIQKIFQEGSKNTYVIIVNKDNVPHQSSDNVSKGKPPPPGAFSSHGKVATRRPTLRDESHECLSQCEDGNKSFHEDVKLNLTNICDDDEYDSGISASNVFLKPEMTIERQTCVRDQSLANMEVVHSEEPSWPARETKVDAKQKVNTYLIQSPLAMHQKQADSVTLQHSFPVIPTQSLASNTPSALTANQAYSTPVTAAKHSAHSAARKIFLVTPTSNSSQSSGSVLKKSIAFTNEAIPTINRPSKYRTVPSPVTVVPRPNPKAVPTASNISPIQHITTKGSPGTPSFLSAGSGFIPVSSCSSSGYGASNKGPLTSTPIIGEVPRISHLKQEAASQKPFYIIPSPLVNRANSEIQGETQFTTTAFTTPQTRTHLSLSPSVCDSSSSFNNESSGYGSASGSLEFCDTPRSASASPSVYASHEEVQLTGDACSVTIDGRTFRYTSHTVEDTDGGVVLSVEDTDEAQKQHVTMDYESEHSVSSSQESLKSDISGKDSLNLSLTNIQWLKGTSMDIKEEKPAFNSQRPSSASHSQTLNWRCLTTEEIKRISEEHGQDKRPPFSYMTMITMALYSREDRKMMLKEICKWIEDTFPYYKYTAKPGWRNSIRHNLSLYNIFVREPKRRHGSYWTIQPDCEPKTKQYKDRSQSHGCSERSAVHHSMPMVPTQQTPGMIPIIPMYSSMGALSAISPQSFSVQQQQQQANSAASKKKGLMPILPRPSPLGNAAPQAYALIPIQNVNQPFSVASQAQQPPMIYHVPSSGSMSACPSPGISEAVASIQVSCASPVPSDFGDPQVAQPLVSENAPVNIVKQAWLDSQNLDIGSSVDSDITSSNEYGGTGSSRMKSKRPRGKPELPKPTIYHKTTSTARKTKGHSKRRKLIQKERNLDESSDEEDDVAKFLSNLDPLKNLDTKDQHSEGMLTTSTPLKLNNPGASPTLPSPPSPIHGFTPLRSANLFEGSFLDPDNDGKGISFSPELQGAKKMSLDISPRLSKLPNSALLDLAMLPSLTPEKGDGSPESNASFSNHNLSKFLSEYGLDPNNVVESAELTDFNWSVIQQMMDTG